MRLTWVRRVILLALSGSALACPKDPRKIAFGTVPALANMQLLCGEAYAKYPRKAAPGMREEVFRSPAATRDCAEFVAAMNAAGWTPLRIDPLSDGVSVFSGFYKGDESLLVWCVQWKAQDKALEIRFISDAAQER